MLLLFELPEFIKSSYPAIAEGLKSFALGLTTLLVGWFITNRITRMVDKVMEFKKVDENLRPFLRSLVNVSLKIFVLLTAASTIGIETTSFAAAVGAAFLAIGLALRNTLSNLASGALVLMFRPYKVGDIIHVQTFTGIVKEIQIFNTVIITPDNQTVILPNGLIANGPIRNLSLAEIRRIDMVFTVKTRTRLDEIVSKLYEILHATPSILKPEETDIFVLAAAAETIDVTVRPWVRTQDYWETYLGVINRIKSELAGMELLVTHTALDATKHFDLDRIGMDKRGRAYHG